MEDSISSNRGTTLESRNHNNGNLQNWFKSRVIHNQVFSTIKSFNCHVYFGGFWTDFEKHAEYYKRDGWIFRLEKIIAMGAE